MKRLALPLALSLLSPLTYADPVVFQTIPEIQQLTEKATRYCMITPTHARLPRTSEIGKDHTTYVSDGKGGATAETSNKITDQVVVARMAQPITGNIYNEWLVPKDVWSQTYGALPTTHTFKGYYRSKPVSAIEITDRVLKLLGSKDGKTALISIPWDDRGMKVYKGGLLAENEYGIAPEERKQNYRAFALKQGETCLDVIPALK